MAQVDVDTAHRWAHECAALGIVERPRAIARIPGGIIVGISSWGRTCEINVFDVFTCKQCCSGTGLSSAQVDGVEEVELFEASTLAVEKDGETEDEEHAAANH